MQEDERCCGTGTCIVDAHGLCWCGQQWNGMEMCRPATGPANPSTNSTSNSTATAQVPAALQTPPPVDSE